MDKGENTGTSTPLSDRVLQKALTLILTPYAFPFLRSEKTNSDFAALQVSR